MTRSSGLLSGARERAHLLLFGAEEESDGRWPPYLAPSLEEGGEGGTYTIDGDDVMVEFTPWDEL